MGRLSQDQACYDDVYLVLILFVQPMENEKNTVRSPF